MARTFKKRNPSAFLEAQKGITTSFSTPFLGKGRFNHSFEVQLSELVPDPDQPRKFFNSEDIKALATSLSEREFCNQSLLEKQKKVLQNGLSLQVKDGGEQLPVLAGRSFQLLNMKVIIERQAWLKIYSELICQQWKRRVGYAI